MDFAERPSLAAYSEADREVIRQRLLAYKEQHGIGVPAFQARIAQIVYGNDYSQDRIGFKTLQRFLSRKPFRTNDTLIWQCHKFLLTVDAADPVKEFGEEASRFYQSAGEPEDLAAHSGAYELFNLDSPRVSRSDPESRRPDGNIVMDVVAHQRFLRTREVLSQIDFKLGASAKINLDDIVAEGVAVMQGGCLLLLLRDALTRQLKTFVFEAHDGKAAELQGVMTAPEFDGAFVMTSQPVNVALRPLEGGAQ